MIKTGRVDEKAEHGMECSPRVGNVWLSGDALDVLLWLGSVVEYEQVSLTFCTIT
jgi:hypothetical protein